MWRVCSAAAAILFFVSVSGQQDVGSPDYVEEVVLNFTCPEPYGIFGDPEQCDLYWECFENQATYKLCDDGLVYDDKLKTVTTEPCDTIDNVDCGNRIYLQPESGTWPCLRKNGLYPYPEDNVCNKFVTCTYNKYSYTSCPSGLQYSKVTKGCTWPADSGRTGCTAERLPSVLGGFVCPNEAESGAGQAVAHTLHADDSDCRKFYICINREIPREAACDLGRVFSLETKICELPTKVPECSHYYDDHPSFAHLAGGKAEFADKVILQDRDFPGNLNPAGFTPKGPSHNARKQELVKSPSDPVEPAAVEPPTHLSRQPGFKTPAIEIEDLSVPL